MYSGLAGCIGMKSDGSLIDERGSVFAKHNDIVFVWQDIQEIFGLRKDGSLVLLNPERFAEPENVFPFLQKAKDVKIP